MTSSIHSSELSSSVATLTMGLPSRAIATLLSLVVLGACSSTPQMVRVEGKYLSGTNYTHAVYNSANQLIHSPIERLRREIDQREKNGRRPISDVYVVCHGWNFTIEESGQLYENYRISLESWIESAKEDDDTFEPYFIFITWGSVERPTSAGLQSLSPRDLPWSLDTIVSAVDRVIFHIPSNWGETQDAFRLALGGPRRAVFDPQTYVLDPKKSDYNLEYDNVVAGVAEAPFPGYQIPVSTLFDELIRMKFGSDSGERFSLHAVGHSYGGKLISLATLDAVARILLAAEAAGVGAENEGSESAGEENAGEESFLSRKHLLDSLVLINPAMKVTEMYFPPDLPLEDGIWLATQSQVRKLFEPSIRFPRVAEAIRRKALVFSYHDSANGWLFGLSQLVLRYEMISEYSTLIPESDIPVVSLLAYGYGLAVGFLMSAIANVGSLIIEPIDATADLFVWEDTKGVWDGTKKFFQKLAAIPLSPIDAQQSMGNRGFRKVGVVAGVFSLRNPWLDGDARMYLNNPYSEDPSFKELTEREWPAKNVEDRREFYSFKAHRVYNGYEPKICKFAEVVNQLAPWKAHGDVRAYESVEGIPKRVRTFNFLYHFTRRR